MVCGWKFSACFGSIFVDSAEADNSIAKTEKKAQGLGGKLGSIIGTAAKVGTAVYAGAGVALGGMLALVNKTSQAADEIDKLSERTGINREELQRWKYAAGQSGADIGKLEVGMKTLSDVMDKAANGNKTASSTFDKLGISLDDIKNKSQSEIFDQVMTSLADMEQGAERNALGNDLLGKSYTELLPLLNAGSGGMDALKARADELGLVMSEESVKANVVFGDTMDDVKQAMGAMMAQIGTSLIPILMEFLDLVLDNMPGIQSVFSTVFGAISSLVGGFINGIGWMVSSVGNWYTENQATVDSIKLGFMEFFATVTDFVTSFIEMFQRYWKAYGDDIMQTVSVIWETIKGVFGGAFDAISGIFKTFSGLFSGDWGKMWEGIKQTFGGVWDGIVSIGKGAMNLVIGFVNKMIDSLNTISWTIPSYIPFLGGKSWGFNLSKIPMLADGGNIINGGSAIVGEAGPELVNLPTGARVTPLTASGITININDANIMDDYGVDRMMDRIVYRLQALGVKA